jgi:PadR family transcriptional regulator, regulatory protein PadR
MASVRMTRVTALVLRAVAAGHRYGFDVMERCELPSGTVYPALRRLDRAGLLASGWEDEDAARAEGRPRRRTYALTRAGRAALPEADEKLAELQRVLEGFPTPEPGEA